MSTLKQPKVIACVLVAWTVVALLALLFGGQTAAVSVVAWPLIAAGLVAWWRQDTKRRAEQAEGARRIECPHCHVVGQVTIGEVREKDGISGGKATGALLTGGVSMLATGLSQKKNRLKGTCGNCRVAWQVS